MLCGLLFYLLTAILLSYAGARLAEHYGQPMLVGAVVGLVFHLPGLIVLWVLLVLLGGGPKGGVA